MIPPSRLRSRFVRLARFAAAAALLPALHATAPAFDAFTDRLAAEWMRANPAAATTQQYFIGAEQDALDRQLTPFTAEARAARVALARRGLAELATFDPATLDATQRTSAAVLRWQLDEVVQSEPFQDFTFPFNQFTGVHVRLVNFLSQTHPIRHRRDIENYLARLALVADQVDEAVAQARDAATRGFLMPDFIYASVLGQFDRFLAGGPAANVLTTSLAQRAAALAEVPAADRAAFVAEAEQIVGATVLPAFVRAQAQLREQQTHATADAGLWRLPGGDHAYAQALRRFTTTDLTAAQIHALGRAEVTRIEAEMDTLLRSLGYTEGTLNARLTQLNADAQPPAGPDPRPALLAEYTRLVRDAEARAARLFDLRPRAAVEVRREPAFTEKTAAAHYSGPSPDGTRPGIFWAPLPGPTFGIIGMKTLVYHEAVPGHHFQIALQREMTGLPRFRRDGVFGGSSAYAEGWALYAEQLAAEDGWYEGDPRGRLGQLAAELFRARRLVVDTGLHALRWTRQQAVDYGIAASEVERYVVMPGQACSYKIGQLKLLELRAQMQAAQGEKFSLREFHNTVLGTGNVPLAVLAEVVTATLPATRAP